MSYPTATPSVTGQTRERRTHGFVGRMSRWQKVVAILGIVVVAWVGSDLTKIITDGDREKGTSGSGAHGPAAPEAGIPADANQVPAGGDAHDPSRFNHG